ncbi:MAG: hypothetical protein KAJ01_10255 [Candidatus Hydrogenedentes bacterium]|nr:hypothetical protein [Candidatus Hydrogenedentota bacterium]
MNSKYAMLLFSLMIALICRPVLGDIVRLKDGRSYEGEIVEENDETIKIKLDVARGTGYVTVRRENIRRIVRQSPEERQRQVEERMRARDLVKDGDEWVTKEEKAAREEQKKAEEARKARQRAPYQREIEKLKREQEERQRKEQAFQESMDRSRSESTTTLRDISLKLVFFAVLGIIAFTLMKRYFWD